MKKLLTLRKQTEDVEATQAQVASPQSPGEQADALRERAQQRVANAEEALGVAQDEAVQLQQRAEDLDRQQARLDAADEAEEMAGRFDAGAEGCGPRLEQAERKLEQAAEKARKAQDLITNAEAERDRLKDAVEAALETEEPVEEQIKLRAQLAATEGLLEDLRARERQAQETLAPMAEHFDDLGGWHGDLEQAVEALRARAAMLRAGEDAPEIDRELLAHARDESWRAREREQRRREELAELLVRVHQFFTGWQASGDGFVDPDGRHVSVEAMRSMIEARRRDELNDMRAREEAQRRRVEQLTGQGTEYGTTPPPRTGSLVPW